MVYIKIKTTPPPATTHQSKNFTFINSRLHDSPKLKMQPKALWSLYAQTVVRFNYYACEKYHETHEIADFEKDGGTQTSLLLC